MVSRKGIESRFFPSNRILELAQHKISKTVWATTPCDKLTWGNQEPIWPLSPSALGAFPTERIQYLARHKRRFSARDDRLRKEEEEVSSTRKPSHTSSKASQSAHIVRLSTPRHRGRSSQEAGPPHTPQCDYNCSLWHVDPRVKTARITPRLLQLSNPRMNHPDFQGNRQIEETFISNTFRKARTSPRLVQLSLPKLKESDVSYGLGHPEESIRNISRAAKRATASPRIETLSVAKKLSKGYIPPQDPEWNRRHLLPV